MRLSLSRAWDETRHIFARDGGLLSAVALALLVLPEIVTGLITPPIENTPTFAGRVIGLVAAFIGVMGQLAIVRLALGPSTTVGYAIGHGARRFPAALGALILLIFAIAIVLIPLMALLMALGMVEVPVQGQTGGGSFVSLVVALAVVAVLLSVKFMMAIPVASAEEAGPVAILRRSWRLTDGYYWPLLGFVLLLLVAALALVIAAQVVGGTLAHLIGGDITPFSLAALILGIFTSVAQAAFTVLASVMLARIYVQLAGRAEAQPGVPTTGI